MRSLFGAVALALLLSVTSSAAICTSPSSTTCLVYNFDWGNQGLTGSSNPAGQALSSIAGTVTLTLGTGTGPGGNGITNGDIEFDVELVQPTATTAGYAFANTGILKTGTGQTALEHIFAFDKCANDTTSCSGTSLFAVSNTISNDTSSGTHNTSGYGGLYDDAANGGTDDSGDGFGQFDAAFGSTNPCGNGGSGGNTAGCFSAVFDVSTSGGFKNLDELISLSETNGGQEPVFFAADVCALANSAASCGNTGLVGANASSAVPEPSSYAVLLTIVLGAMGFVYARRRRNTTQL